MILPRNLLKRVGEVASSPVMPQSAKILMTACPEPAVPLEDCQRECCRVIHSASPRRSRNTEPSSSPPSCMAKRPAPSIGSRSGPRAISSTSLRSITCTKRQDYVSNEEVVKRSSLPIIEPTLLQVQLRWVGRVARTEDIRISKAVISKEFSKERVILLLQDNAS